ncbi:substrate-binding periplasmic protein [Catenuloplanes atrovinosus]|uniref:Polar amino acid transport system substrate-binding protein n=1 Tax=Catenuloplanes atrovinosus TaxID=137266 RepID=A0AAE3YV64_9ACTN|nr:transporter substrate-binding domain-containing protein [Catenuloplanes atrovinosus]MDR7279241.1 polar amino acid transport system substrate-binding protein [Catenuloplanes atrovinosus]
MRGRLAALAGVLLIVTGCDWPRDADGTLDRVRGGVLRAGVTESPPWTEIPDGGEPTGAEAELVRRLATALGARVEWYPGTESALMPALKQRSLDVVVGGLDATAPWTQDASLTRPYLTARTVVAARPGIAVPDDLDGVRVAVRGGTGDVATLAATDADVVEVAEITGAEGIPGVVEDWELAPLGLVGSTHELGTTDHVWAVPPGENGWQAEVETFLLNLSHDEIVGLLT